MSAGDPGRREEDVADRFTRVAKRAAPMLGVALVCYTVGTLADFDGAPFLVDLSPVLVILALSSAVFTWFDRR